MCAVGDGDEIYQRGPLKPELRRPAAELGPRATRTRNRILAAAKALYLERGYNGVSVGDIAEACNISPANFYTYFGSQRDVFIMLGIDCYHAMDRAVSDFVAMMPDWTDEKLEQWILSFMGFMNEHGVFVGAWAEAAYNDEELRSSAMGSELREARRLGKAIMKVSGYDGDAVSLGLSLLAMLERFWYFWRVFGIPMEESQVLQTLRHALSALLLSPGRARGSGLV